VTSMVLNIPESTPSLNGLFQGHWSKRHRMRVKWGWLVRAARLEARLFPAQPLQKAKLTVERWGPIRLDYDNYVAGVKYLTDSLKTEGFIVDDSPDHIVTQYIQHIGPRHTRVRIEHLNV
jgi:Holliday junction resolvase RusA-like endonuclease